MSCVKHEEVSRLMKCILLSHFVAFFCVGCKFSVVRVCFLRRAASIGECAGTPWTGHACWRTMAILLHIFACLLHGSCECSLPQEEANSKEVIVPGELPEVEKEPEKTGKHKPQAKGRRRRRAACLQESAACLVVNCLSLRMDLVLLCFAGSPRS